MQLFQIGCIWKISWIVKWIHIQLLPIKWYLGCRVSIFQCSWSLCLEAHSKIHRHLMILNVVLPRVPFFLVPTYTFDIEKELEVRHLFIAFIFLPCRAKCKMISLKGLRRLQLVNKKFPSMSWLSSSSIWWLCQNMVPRIHNYETGTRPLH